MKGRLLPQSTVLLLVIAVQLRCNRCQRAEQSIGFFIWSRTEEERIVRSCGATLWQARTCRRRAGATQGAISKHEGPKAVDHNGITVCVLHETDEVSVESVKDRNLAATEIAD